MKPVLSFRVKGLPAPQGSKQVFGGHTVESNPKTRPWRAIVTDAAEQAIAQRSWQMVPRGVPVEVTLFFYKPRPRAHFRTGRYSDQVRDDAPDLVSTGPDIDKLTRAMLDGMKVAGVYADDSQVAALHVRHEWRHEGPFAQGGVWAVVGEAFQ